MHWGRVNRIVVQVLRIGRFFVTFFGAIGVVPAQGCSKLEKEDGVVCHN